MKKHLLIFAGLITSAFSFSQFTQDTEAAIGSGSTLYVIDSMAPAYESVTGSGVEWDYSSYGGYPGEDRNLTVLDPDDTDFANDFPNATAALDIQNFLKNFTYSTSTEKVSPGFIYTDAQLGEVVVAFDTDEAKQYDYPFAVGDNFTDTYEGTATLQGQQYDAEGELKAKVDGEGTLKLADGNNIPNVTRYKLSDSTVVSTGVFGDVVLTRVQYEYYDLNDSNNSLPLFVLAEIEISGFIEKFKFILSSVEPTITAGIEENILSSANVYPNPASEVINISLKNKLLNTKVSVVDAMGREVLNKSIETDFVALDVAHLEEGMYFVKISNGDFVETKTVVIK